jgi:hypothetical protein
MGLKFAMKTSEHEVSRSEQSRVITIYLAIETKSGAEMILFQCDTNLHIWNTNAGTYGTQKWNLHLCHFLTHCRPRSSIF